MDFKECNWCGAYIPEGKGIISFHGDYYCSRRCYEWSGTEKQDIIDRKEFEKEKAEAFENKVKMANEKTVKGFFYRILRFFLLDNIGLSIAALIISFVLGNLILKNAPSVIRNASLGFWLFFTNAWPLLILVLAVICPLIESTLFIFIGKRTPAFSINCYLLIFVACTIFGAVSFGNRVELSEKQIARRNAKAGTAFEKTYNSEMDLIVGKEYNAVTIKNNKPQSTIEVFLTKDGISHNYSSLRTMPETESEHIYTVDTKNRLITLKRTGKENSDVFFWYTADGNIIYPAPKKDKTKEIIKKDGDKISYTLGYAPFFVNANAAFSPENAKEVIGKTYTGKWNDAYNATITFGKDGNATLKFSDGDVTQGTYIANAEGNFILYNHRNQRVWYAFTYNGNDASNLKFLQFKPLDNKDKYTYERQYWTKSE